MATIDWAGAITGNWTTAADWTGGIVPGPGDTAAIDPKGKTKFTISITSPVDVAAIDLNSSGTLALENALAVGTLTLTKGSLYLDNGAALSGTIVDALAGNSVKISAGSETLTNITCLGTLDIAASRGRSSQHITLTIDQGLTLADLSGTGAGTALFAVPVILDHLASLDNATISLPGMTIENAPTFTLGSKLTLDIGTIGLTNGGTLINNGTINDGPSISGSAAKYGIFINDGTINGGLDAQFVSLTNNGTINLDGGTLALSLAEVQPAGPHAAIDNNAGQVTVIGTLTTAQLRNLFSTQHITNSGNTRFVISGDLDNTGDRVNIGTGTAFGAVGPLDYALLPTLIEGGQVVDHGGNGPYNLDDAHLFSTSPTLSSAFGTWTDTTVSGVTAIACGLLDLNNVTLDGVGTLTSTASYEVTTLNGVTFTGLGVSAQPVINALGTLAIDKPIDGVLFNLEADSQADGTDVEVADGVTLDHTIFNIPDNLGEITNTGSFGLSFGAGFVANIAVNAAEIVGQAGSSTINDGVFNVAGLLELSYGTGGADATFSGTGTINLEGTSSNAAGLDVYADVAAGQTIAFVSGADRIYFATPGYAANFKATLSGFAPGDSLYFVGDTFKSAKFVGDTLVAKLSNGGSIVLATSTAETGMLKITHYGSDSLITYTKASAADWSAFSSQEKPQATTGRDVGAWTNHTPDFALLAIDPHGWF